LSPRPASPTFSTRFGLVVVAVFGIGFVVSAYLTGSGGNNVAGVELEAAEIHHWATVGLWIFGPGLYFFAMRALQINPLSFGEPIWLVASIFALIVTACVGLLR
jgi:hypothetical protein